MQRLLTQYAAKATPTTHMRQRSLALAHGFAAARCFHSHAAATVLTPATAVRFPAVPHPRRCESYREYCSHLLSLPTAYARTFHSSTCGLTEATPPSASQSSASQGQLPQPQPSSGQAKPATEAGANTPTSTSSSSGGGSARRSSSGSSSRARAEQLRSSNSNLLQYLVGIAVLVVGASWAAVPLYRAFCAHTGYGGTTQTDKDGSKLATLKPGKKEVVISFNADVSPAMHWKFTPIQKQLKVRLGEPVLAFYKATNLRDKAITGVATYNVTPQKSGAYFHKIQCFCFDEQRLRANETVDMPVFFYVDPAMEQDPRCQDVTHLTLSYTFFPVEEDEDDTRTEAEKDAASGVRLHGTGVMPSFTGTMNRGGSGTTPITQAQNSVPK